jgi:hypothetical protein
MPIPDALFLDQDLNFWCLKEFFTTNDKIIVYIFSFDEPMWEHDILFLKQQINNIVPLVCISKDKEFYKYVSTEFFKKHNLKLLFDPKGYNTKLNFSEEKKVVVVYKNLVYDEVDDLTQIRKKLIQKYNVNEEWKIINLLITCGISGVLSACASCPETYNIGGWLQRESILSAYKTKLQVYTIDLGNFLTRYATKEEVEKMLYAMVLSNYDKIVINENEMDKLFDIYKNLIEEQQYEKFVLPVQKIQSFNKEEKQQGYDYKKIWQDKINGLTVVYLPYQTKNYREIIKNITKNLQEKNIILVSNLGYFYDIEILNRFPEIKLVISGNHNYNVPQMIKYNDVPIIFPSKMSGYITRICLYVLKEEIKKVKVSLIPVLPTVKINSDLSKMLEEKMVK